MSPRPPDERFTFSRSEKYCGAALWCFCGAIFLLSIVAFTLNPTSLPGLLSIALGILLMLATIILFIGYSRESKKEERQNKGS